MHRSFAPFALLVLLPELLPAQARPSGDLARCAGIGGDQQRLACYDSLARGSKVFTSRSPAVSSDSTGQWQVLDQINPLDDTRTVALVLYATSGKSRFGVPVGLILRCQSHRTQAYVNWNEYLGSDDAVVTSRLGPSEAKTRSWNLSSDHEATFVPGNIPEFIQQLAVVNTYVVQVTPYNESPITATFDLTGLQTAMRPLRAACGW